MTPELWYAKPQTVPRIRTKDRHNNNNDNTTTIIMIIINIVVVNDIKPNQHTIMHNKGEIRLDEVI